MVGSPPKVPVRVHVIAVAPEPSGPAVELAPGGLGPVLGPGPELAV